MPINTVVFEILFEGKPQIIKSPKYIQNCEVIKLLAESMQGSLSSHSRLQVGQD